MHTITHSALKTALLSLVLFFQCNIQLTGQCTNLCQKAGSNGPILSQKTINDINTGDFEKIKGAYAAIKSILSASDEHYLDEYYQGVGCFYFYYAYAKLTAELKTNPAFVKHLSENKDELFFSEQKAKTVLGYCQQIIENTHDVSCKQLRRGIFGSKVSEALLNNRREVFKKDIAKLQNALSAEEVDLFVAHFTIEVTAQEMIAWISVGRQNAANQEHEVTVEWNPDPSQGKQIRTIHFMAGENEKDVILKAARPTSVPFVSHLRIKPLETESNYDNNEDEYDFRTIIDKPDPNPKSFQLSFSTTKAGIDANKEGIAEEGDNCIVIDHYFDKGVLEHSNSQELNDIIFNKVLRRHLQKADLQGEGSVIEVIGYADGLKITSEIRNSYGFINNVRYYSKNKLDTNRNSLPAFMSLSANQQIKLNQELAFLRAFILRESIINAFRIDKHLITLHTDTTNVQNDSKKRRSHIRICSSLFTKDVMNKIYEEVLYLRDGGEYIPEPKAFADSEEYVLEPEIPANTDDQVLKPESFTNPKERASEPELPTNPGKQDYAFPEARVGNKIEVKNLFFEENMAEITVAHQPILNNLAEALKASSTVHIK
ncbi:MAG: hypothetical protein AAFO02_16295, partial [Bacteroidota bacterium]